MDEAREAHVRPRLPEPREAVAAEGHRARRRDPPRQRPRGPVRSWGECPACQYFPAPVHKTSGLKACVVDQTGDPPFYNSSLALHEGWLAAGMKSEASYHPGAHCQTHSYEWIAQCLDDGTGRLIGGQQTSE